ncbi:MAG: hypothetical protein WKF73_22410 [Nocardioidaceae bacterium]
MDLSSLLDGHRVCEEGNRLVRSGGLASWRSPGARARLEWVNRVYLVAAPGNCRNRCTRTLGVAAMRRCLAEATREVRAALEPCGGARE